MGGGTRVTEGTRPPGWTWPMTFVVVALLATLWLPAAASAGNSRPFGDAKILAKLPPEPGFPEGVAVKGNRVFVAGPATFGTTGKGPSAVLVFDIHSGGLVSTYPTQNENLLAEHANSSIAFDGNGRLYVLNTQLGIYRLSPETGVQETYAAPFPDLKPCVPLAVRPPCSPTPTDAPALPNDIAFDEAGNAYVTDSMQATIWRVPAGPVPTGVRTPDVWFQDSRLASTYIGTNGIRLNPARTEAYITVTTDLLQRSFVYRLPLVSDPDARDLKAFHQYGPDALPDGIAFGRSGLLYVAIASPGASGVSVLDTGGTEVVRLSNPPLSLFAPYDSPANIAFNGHGSILLTNHAFVTGVLNPGQFSVVDVFVDDKESPLAKPNIP